jgi:lysophospholipase L1-like esterase
VLFFVVAGCAAHPKGPPSEVVAAPFVARADGDGASSATPIAAASSRPAPSLAFSTTVGHLEGPGRLAHLFEAFSALEDGHTHDDVRILQYGDSHTAADVGTGAFRRLLQARFGDGGRGFASIGRPWKFYGQDGVRGGMTREFEPQRITFKDGHVLGDGCYGLLGVGIGAETGGARAWSEIAPRFSHVELDYWQQPRGGSFDVFVDGARAGRIATRAAQPGSGYFGFDLADVPHQVELRTVGDGEVRVFGMTLDREQAGVVVDALGINGAQIVTLLHANEDHFTEQLRHRAPQLVILAYGTNEALEPGLTDAEYERKVVEVLGRVERAAPAASCLLLGPPDLARHTKGRDDWKTLPRVVEIVAAQRRVAEAAGCSFYDQLDAMGGPGSIAAWASEPEPRGGRDRVHLTRSGYVQLGTSFATDLLRAYDDWRAEKGLTPIGAKVTWAKE